MNYAPDPNPIEVHDCYSIEDVRKDANREIKRLQDALGKIHEIAKSCIFTEYSNDREKMLNAAIDMSFAMGRIQAIAVVQRDLKVRL